MQRSSSVPAIFPPQRRRLLDGLQWIALAGLTLSMTWPGLQQGLGYIPEEVRRVSIAVQMASTGDLNPHWFGHPASLLIYSLSTVYKCLSIASDWGVLNRSWSDLLSKYLTEPTGLFLIGRFLARLTAVAAVIATFEVGIRVMPRNWAFAAATLTATNPIFITNANRLRCDHILTIFLLLATRALAKSIPTAKAERNQAHIGILTGIAITYKYLAGCILVAQAAVIASLEIPLPQKLRSIARTTAFAGAASFVASPFLWLDLPQVLRDVLWEATKQNFSWNPLLSIAKIITVLRYGFSDLGCSIILIAALFGLWRLIKDGRKGLIIRLRKAGQRPYEAMILILLTYLGTTLLSTRWNATWMAPIVPFFTLILINESVHASEKLSSHPWISKRGYATNWVLMTLILITIVSSQLSEDSSIRSMRIREPAVRQAERWIEQHIPDKSRILLWQPMPDQDGFFPRVRIQGASLLKVKPKGLPERICTGERVNRYETTKKITEEPCYPRPRIRSQLDDGHTPVLNNIDFLITSSREAPKIPIRDESGKIVTPTAIFSQPPFRRRLSYPKRDNFPEGDYGMWRHIRIYKLNENINS